MHKGLYRTVLIWKNGEIANGKVRQLKSKLQHLTQYYFPH